MPKRILIVDSDEAFATMLREGLEDNESYEVRVVDSGQVALARVEEEIPELVIVDSALEDMPVKDLLTAIHRFEPPPRIMLIPLKGEELDDELKELDIEGILTKPFFMGDLIPKIEAVLAQRSPELLPTFDDQIEAINQHLADLHQEVKAEAVLLMYGKQLLAHAGNLDRDKSQELASLVGKSLTAAAEVASFLGEAENRFQQTLHEGRECRLYSLSFAPDLILVVALRSDTPPGMIRYNTRQTADLLLKIVHG